MFVAFAGVKVTVSVVVLPISRLPPVKETSTPVAGTVGAAGFLTVMVQVSVNEPSAVVTVITAEPSPTAVTTPF